jgi:hypothetical protein
VVGQPGLGLGAGNRGLLAPLPARAPLFFVGCHGPELPGVDPAANLAGGPGERFAAVRTVHHIVPRQQLVVIVENDVLAAALELLRQVPAAGAAPVQRPGKHLLQQIDRPGEQFHEVVIGGVAEEGLRQPLPDIDHHGIFLQEPHELYDALLPGPDPRQGAQVPVDLVVLLQVQERPDLRHVIKVFEDRIVAVLFPNARLDRAAVFGDPGKDRHQEALFEILIEERRVGKVPAAAVRALDDVELPAEDGLFHLRGARHIDPGDDLGLKVAAAVPAVECFLAVCLNLIDRQVQHDPIIHTIPKNSL